MNKYILVFCMVLLSACGGSSFVIQGTQGVVGPKGEQGIPGLNGVNASCNVSSLAVGSVVAPNGGSLITCSDGSSSLVLNGYNGSNGTNGLAGTPGTLVTPVKFCPGFVQSYPSVFAESGVCIAGVMYGVYSDHGGFMAELPPGNYSSNGINASCNFTISANCVVN